MCLLHGFSLFVSHCIAVLFTRGLLCYISVLECFIRLQSSPLVVYYIFVACMTHHFGVLSMCASFHCASLHICLIILQSSPYVLHHIVLLSICALWHCISRHIYLITLCFCPCMPHYNIFLCMCRITCCFLHTFLFTLLISSYVP